MGMISEQDAINYMLVNAGESPVTDLVTDAGVDTGIAQQLLDEALLDVQLRGLVDNWAYVETEPDSNGQILLPTGDSDDEGVISADLVSVHYSNNYTERRLRIVARVQDSFTIPKLYNVTDDTDIWETGVTYRIYMVKKLKWEHIDTPMQRYIMTKAARRYQMFIQADEEADLYLQQEEYEYKSLARAEDIKDRGATIFNSGPCPVMRIGNRRHWSGYGLGSDAYRYPRI